MWLHTIDLQISVPFFAFAKPDLTAQDIRRVKKVAVELLDTVPPENSVWLFTRGLRRILPVTNLVAHSQLSRYGRCR